MGAIGRDIEHTATDRGGAAGAIGIGDGERAGSRFGERPARDPESTGAAERVVLRAVVEGGGEGSDIGGIDIDRGRSGGRVVKEHVVVVEIRGGRATENKRPVFIRSRGPCLPVPAVEARPFRRVAGNGEREGGTGIGQGGGGLPSGQTRNGAEDNLTGSGPANRSRVTEQRVSAIGPYRRARVEGDVTRGVGGEIRGGDGCREVPGGVEGIDGGRTGEVKGADGQGSPTHAVVVGNNPTGASADVDRVDGAVARHRALGQGDRRGNRRAAILHEGGPAAIHRDAGAGVHRPRATQPEGAGGDAGGSAVGVGSAEKPSPGILLGQGNDGRAVVADLGGNDVRSGVGPAENQTSGLIDASVGDGVRIREGHGFRGAGGVVTDGARRPIGRAADLQQTIGRGS